MSPPKPKSIYCLACNLWQCNVNDRLIIVVLEDSTRPHQICFNLKENNKRHRKLEISDLVFTFLYNVICSLQHKSE